MSQKNGDRSRFHRLRKQKILRRERLRELLKALRTKAPGAARPDLEDPPATRL
ncbi:MAG: hypothetical protein HY648_13795 [Acidobacteria bacterium]|nr:hypothetical protein [Acidobacteriota bacterium]